MSMETYPIRVHDKELCMRVGAEVIRTIIEENLEFRTDRNLSKIALETDIKRATKERDKLLSDNVYYENMIQENKKRIRKFDSIIQSKNVELRAVIDKLNKEEKEFIAVWSKIKELIKENKFNELEMQELLESVQYNTPKQIITNIIQEMKKENMTEELISIAENCL